MKATGKIKEIQIVLPADCSSSDSVLAVTGEIRQAILKKPERLVLDGSGVTRLGSVTIGTFASVQQEMESYGGKLVFYDFSLSAMSPFELCRVKHHFTWESP